MDRKFGEWYSLVDPNADHSRNKSRWEGVEAFSKSATAEDIIELSRVFFGYPALKSEFIETFQEPFLEIDSTFPLKNNNSILSVLAGASLASILKDRKNLSLKTAYAVTCPSFNYIRPNIIIPEIVDRSNEYLIKQSSVLRSAQDIKKMKSPAVLLEQLSAEIMNHINNASPPDAAEEMSAFLNKLSSTIDTVVTKVNSIITQQNLDREESDILWWAFGQYSRDLNEPIKDFDLLFSSLIAAKEISDLTRVLPGPFAFKAFISKFLAVFSENYNDQYPLKDFINSAPIEWRTEWFSEYQNSYSVNLCPVISAIVKSVDDPGSDDWYKAYINMLGLKNNIQLTPLAISSQLYYEIHFLRLLDE